MLHQIWLLTVAALGLFALVSARSDFTCPTAWTPTTSVAPGQPTVYMIRHGEKLDADHKWDLNATGRCRAMCVERLFSDISQYNITKIMVETPKCKQEHDGRKHQRPALTAANLARKLKLDMDMCCDETDHQCVADTVHSYTYQGNVLIVWEHHNLQCIAERLQVTKKLVPVTAYPQVFDKIWTATYPFTTIDITDEVCTEIDDGNPSKSCLPDPAYLCPEKEDRDKNRQAKCHNYGQEHKHKICVPVFGTRDCDAESREEL